MAQESSPARSPRDLHSRSSDSDDDINTSIYPFDELRNTTDDSWNSSADMSSFTTQSFSEADYNKSSISTRHLSRSARSDTSIEKPTRKSPKGLRIHELRRKPLHNTDPKRRNEQTPTKRTKEEPPVRYWNYVLIIFAIIVIPYLFEKWFFGAKESTVKQETVPELDGRELMVSNFMKSFIDVRSQFPSQTKRLWATVSASCKSVLKTETPSQPGILLLVSSAEGKQTMRCLTQKLSEMLMKVYNDGGVTVFHVDDHLSLNGSQLKLEIDKVFHDGLGIRHEHVVILHDLDKVSGQAAMMFFGYCDTESAPFKDAVIIFTMEVSPSKDSLMSMTEKEVEELADSRLLDLWKADIGYDNTMALKSRIANNFGVIRPENSTKAVC